MKRLLLLFILSPVILFGQMRPGAIVDSINAHPTSIKAAADLISNNQRTRIEHIRASDSGEYVTIVTRIRVIEPLEIAAIFVLSVIKMEPKHAMAGITPLLAVPHMPYVNIEIEHLRPHLLTQFAIEPAVLAKANAAGLPPLPCIPDIEVHAVPLYTIKQLVIKPITAPKMTAATVPPIPDFPIDELPVVAALELAFEKRPLIKMDTLPVPVYEEKKMPVAEMHLSPEGYSLLEKLEGFSPKLYALQDGGLTIGFGFFVPYGESNKWKKGVTWEEAELIMKQKVPAYEDQVKKYINVPLTQNMFDALTMIAYNLGGFSKATSIVNDINSEADFEQLQKDWMRFVHSKAPGVMKGLTNRRKDEMKVRNESDYQPERKIQILKNIQ